MTVARLWSGVAQVLQGFLKSYAFLLIGGAIISIGILAISRYYQDAFIFVLGVMFLKHLYCGLITGFLVHEITHALLISITMRDLKQLQIESTFMRFSIQAVGSSTGRGVFLTALSGPMAVVTFGVFIYFVFPNSGLLGWYVVHLFFLFPFFGDGRAIIFGLRHWRSVVHLPSDRSVTVRD